MSVLSEGMNNMIKMATGLIVEPCIYLFISILPNLSDDHFLRMPFSSSTIPTSPLLKQGMKNIVIKAELIVKPFITFCSQIDSSKFIRDLYKRLFPITKVAYHCTWFCWVWCCCLRGTEAMDLLNNEMHDEIDDKEKQIYDIQVEEDREHMWWNSKARYVVEFQSFSLSHLHSSIAMKTYRKKYLSILVAGQNKCKTYVAMKDIPKKVYHIVMEDRNMKRYQKKFIIYWWKTETWRHTKKSLSYIDGRQKQMECYY